MRFRAEDGSEEHERENAVDGKDPVGAKYRLADGRPSKTDRTAVNSAGRECCKRCPFRFKKVEGPRSLRTAASGRSDDARHLFVHCGGRPRQRRGLAMSSGRILKPGRTVRAEIQGAGDHADESLKGENGPGGKRRGKLLVKSCVRCEFNVYCFIIKDAETGKDKDGSVAPPRSCEHGTKRRAEGLRFIFFNNHR